MSVPRRTPVSTPPATSAALLNESHSLITITELRTKGNEEFKIGRFKEACILYGQCLEAMIRYEPSILTDDNEFNRTKVSIFSNLAASNLKLQAYDGAKRCCNAAIVFCNKPDMALADLGVDDDITMDVELTEPVIFELIPSAAKALYRRAQCNIGLKEKYAALHDLEITVRLLPSDKVIQTELKGLREKLSVRQVGVTSPLFVSF
jgi:tetratricopeptide (TPR) repeat protein